MNCFIYLLILAYVIKQKKKPIAERLNHDLTFSLRFRTSYLQDKKSLFTRNSKIFMIEDAEKE